ncbi:glycoside hydrolase family 99-like domain-containing protein [Thiothrix subterranea]|uniref:Glycoside hydrolase family 99-like domain-containing protein n=1 Tax=Thiothrix subterranea TaxID=2735563 RepID=A0AA51R1N2_9GAMM|nr:glycoside hydrolase family 99-like domain-containing protein [Thiothrix subterranea]MDQ5768376.1 glycoside hydrolase family 99-like domain-containing protein [Thiothrix subterranea]WML86964.1 glycoside hydrolase family 99-like domain-containing protein [Thiothrix subterranea]
MDFTGERFMPEVHGNIELEHLHRYLLASKVVAGKTVLDIASGEGYGSAMMAQTALDIIGVDISHEAVIHAQTKYQRDNLEYRQGSCSAIPLDDASVDVVVSFETIEHHDEHDAMMHEIKRVLRPNGVLIISNPDKLEFTDKPATLNPHHIKELYRDEFTALLDEHFKHRCVYGQRVVYGSAILCEDGLSPTGSYEVADAHLPEIPGVPYAMYLIAVASDADIALPVLNSGILEQRIEDTEITRFWRGLMAERDAQISSLVMERNNLVAERDCLTIERNSLAAEREGMLNSISFKVTKPLRVMRPYVVKTYQFTRKVISVWAKHLWQQLPISPQQKAVLKDKLFKAMPPQLVSWSRTYRSWAVVEDDDDWDDLPLMPAHGNVLAMGAYVPLLQVPPPESVPVKLIAFYLPQFHAIAENNAWWGEGFTEWTNVKPAQPQFVGHYQPHVPDELGYYDLLNSSVQQRQVALAKLYGVGGFCFYTYWFGGKLLLEKPVENYLKDRSLDLPFCLCWANENWSRRWDGLESELLMTQQHSPEDDLHFIQYVAQYMRDERYIRINGKPLLLVYRPSLLPSAKDTTKCWREWCAQNGIGEIYLAYTQSFEAVNPKKYGFDAAIEFPPNNVPLANLADTVKPLNERFTGKVYDWRAFVKRSRHYKKPAYPLFRSVCPAWDNTARRKHNGTIYINSTPEYYQEWLSNAVADTCERVHNSEERLVFVNAWNEWAEGAHLEPDQHYGYAYLEATRRALTNEGSFNSAGKILVVSHDAHPHGAQFLALGMVRALKHDLHFDVEVVLLGDGRLEKEFVALANIHKVDIPAQGEGELVKLANALMLRGYTKAIVNTTVAGCVIPVFQDAGIESNCLVHELPGVIQQYHLEDCTKKIAEHAKTVVFPAQTVADGFAQFAQVDEGKQVIRPQGLYRRNQWRLEKKLARSTLRERLGLDADTKIVLTVGYADHRKGVDLFVECALQILAQRKDVDFVWVGHWEQGMQEQIEALLATNPYKNRIHFVGFHSETALFYAASDVYALTSREDPFPSVVLESFDAGVPVVAFAGTGGASILVEKVGGLVAPELDVAAFSSAIKQLLDDAALSASLGDAAQNHVDEHFAFRPYLFDLCEMLGVTIPKVSVIVPNYNYAQYIEQRLASIYRQSIPVFELILLDDASTDKSIPAISKWLAATQTEAKVVVNEKNSGNVFAQWQKGIALAKGDYIWIAEADDLSDPNFLQTVLPPLVSAEAVLSYCESQQINAQGMVMAKNYQDYLSVVSPDKWKHAYALNGHEECASSLAVLNTIPNVSAVVFNSAVIKKVFSENFDEIKSYQKAGDWVVYMHVLAQGNIAYSPTAANRHRRHENSVIAGKGRQLLLEEIGKVQQLYAAHYPVTENARLKAANYLDYLKKEILL